MPDTDPFFGKYQIIHAIEENALGRVFLCRKSSDKTLRLLKITAFENAGKLERKYAEILRFQKLCETGNSSFFLPVEEAEKNGNSLYCIIPIPDGSDKKSPDDPDWRPRTLSRRISKRLHNPDKYPWFSCEKIKSDFSEILEAIRLLDENGISHGNIGTGSIFYRNGRPCLGGISAAETTRDALGPARILFALLTGNSLRRIAEEAYCNPPIKEAKMPPAERREWKRLMNLTVQMTFNAQNGKKNNFESMKKSVLTAPAKGKTYGTLSLLALMFIIAGVAVAGLRARRELPASRPVATHITPVTGDTMEDAELDPNAIGETLPAGSGKK